MVLDLRYAAIAGLGKTLAASHGFTTDFFDEEGPLPEEGEEAPRAFAAGGVGVRRRGL